MSMKLIPKNKNSIASFVLIEHRCSCGKLLFKGMLLSSALEIKCKGCGKIKIVGNQSIDTENENQYSMLFDEANNIIDVSPSAIKILGFSKQELLAMKARRIKFLFKMHDSDRLWKTARNLGFETFTFETVHLKKNGEVSPVQAQVKFITSSNQALALVVFNGLQSPSTQVTDSTCEFVADVNLEGIYTYVNRALATLLEYSAEEMLGKSMFEFYPIDERKKIEKIFFSHLKSKQSFKLKDSQFESYFVTNVNDWGGVRGYHILRWAK